MNTATREAGVVDVSDVDSAALAIEGILNNEPEELETEGQKQEAEPSEVDGEEAEETETEEESDDQETEPDEPEEANFSTIEELAEALDISIDDFMDQISVEVKADGKQERLTLKEVQDGQQRYKDYQRKTMELADDKRNFETERAQVQQQLQNNVQQLEVQLQTVNQQLLHEFNAVDWQSLRFNDPAEFAAKQQDFSNRQAEINQAQQQANQQVEYQKQVVSQEQQQQHAAYLANELKALETALPEWSSEKESIQTYLSDFGFTSDEIKGAADHRHIVLARKAMLYDQSQKGASLAKKKVKSVPKMLKPGAKQNQVTQKQNRSAALKQKLRGSGRAQDAAALILDRM